MKRKSEETVESKSKSMKTSSSSSNDSDEQVNNRMDGQEVTSWTVEKTLCVFKYKFKNESVNNKIAAFDMDGTLIKTKSGNKFAKDIDDWKMFSSAIKTKINKLINDGYDLVIFSNQTGVRYGHVLLKDIKTKFENIIRHLDVPCVALFCTDLDKYRKPCIGMFDYYRKSINKTELDLAKSFYCGDVRIDLIGSNLFHI